VARQGGGYGCRVPGVPASSRSRTVSHRPSSQTSRWQQPTAQQPPPGHRTGHRRGLIGTARKHPAPWELTFITRSPAKGDYPCHHRLNGQSRSFCSPAREDHRCGEVRTPRDRATVTAAVRSLTPGLTNVLSRCVFTVASPMYSCRPIPPLDRPRATRPSTSTSRGVSCSPAGSPGRHRSRPAPRGRFRGVVRSV
jgi:hypothetical protein